MKRFILSVCLFLNTAALYAADHNRASWTDSRLEVGYSPLYTKGLRAKSAIKKGEMVAIFGGNVMNREQVLQLPVGSVGNVLQIDDALWIGSMLSEKADYINHSCEPNAGLQGQITLVAMRNIAAGEEVTFDYGTVISEWVGMDPRTCNCGATDCRKIVNANDWQQKALQEKYRGYFAYYLQKKINALKISDE